MHEIGTHVIDIQISENTTIIYSNDIKITWNQVKISLCALSSTSRLAQQSETLPMMPPEHKTHLHWPSLAAPDPKRGSGETVYKKFELWNVYWMTFTCYVSALFTSQHPFNQIRLQHHQTNSATLFIQH